MASPTQPGVQPLAVTKTALPELLSHLENALSGGPAIVPLPGDGRDRHLLRTAMTLGPDTLAPGTALLVPTSGSTGDGKLVALTADNLLASAWTTLRVIGGPGRWWLSLPLGHVAGWLVLVRSLIGGFPDVATEFVVDVRYGAMVPTQLRRLLAEPDGVARLRSMDAILLGGAAAPADLLSEAAAQGVRVIRSYGMSETTGGCVYDGQPLPGTSLRLEPGGRIQLGGGVVAAGYADDQALTDQCFRSDSKGVRWFRTHDVGELDENGRLHLLGRIDDVIVTGGEKVHPSQVEGLLQLAPGVDQALVVGVPDPEWGQRVVAVITLKPGAQPPPLADVRWVVAERIGKAAAPQQVVVTDRLPVTGIGKPDRAAAISLACGDSGPGERQSGAGWPQERRGT